MIGEHFIKGWPRTQNSVTLSSAEAGLVAMCKAAAELLGCIAMWREWGEERRGVVLADSSAALAISQRKGSGKLRHINIGLLWVQERRERQELNFYKVKGEKNPADLLTKYLAAERAKQHEEALGLERREGRASTSLKMQGS